MDVVGAALAAMEGGPCGIYNIGTGRSYSVLELAKAIAAVFPERKVSVELKPLMDASLKGLPALAIEKAASTWKYRPRSLQEGLEDYRQKMESVKLIKGK